MSQTPNIQAPNVQVILNHRKNVWQSAVNLLTSFGFPQVLLPRDGAQTQENHLAVSVGSLTPLAQGYVPPNQELEWTEFDAELNVWVVTDRRSDTSFAGSEIGSMHDDWVTKVKSVLLNSNRYAWNDSTKGNLLYYVVLAVRPISEDDGTEEKTGRDVTQLSYMVRISTPYECWPDQMSVS